jgi:hypothetical protein
MENLLPESSRGIKIILSFFHTFGRFRLINIVCPSNNEILDRCCSSLVFEKLVIVHYFVAGADDHAKNSNIADIILSTITELLAR